jgi:hypothetical protein
MRGKLSDSVLIGHSILPILRDGKLISHEFFLPIFLNLPKENYFLSLSRTGRDSMMDPLKGSLHVNVKDVSTLYSSDPFIHRFLSNQKASSEIPWEQRLLEVKTRFRGDSRSKKALLRKDVYKDNMFIKMSRSLYKSGWILQLKVKNGLEYWRLRWAVVNGTNLKLHKTPSDSAVVKQVDLTSENLKISLQTQGSDLVIVMKTDDISQTEEKVLSILSRITKFSSPKSSIFFEEDEELSQSTMGLSSSGEDNKSSLLFLSSKNCNDVISWYRDLLHVTLRNDSLEKSLSRLADANDSNVTLSFPYLFRFHLRLICKKFTDDELKILSPSSVFASQTFVPLEIMESFQGFLCIINKVNDYIPSGFLEEFIRSYADICIKDTIADNRFSSIEAVLTEVRECSEFHPLCTSLSDVWSSILHLKHRADLVETFRLSAKFSRFLLDLIAFSLALFMKSHWIDSVPSVHLEKICSLLSLLSSSISQSSLDHFLRDRLNHSIAIFCRHLVSFCDGPSMLRMISSVLLSLQEDSVHILRFLMTLSEHSDFLEFCEMNSSATTIQSIDPAVLFLKSRSYDPMLFPESYPSTIYFIPVCIVQEVYHEIAAELRSNPTLEIPQAISSCKTPTILRNIISWWGFQELVARGEFLCRFGELFRSMLRTTLSFIGPRSLPVWKSSSVPAKDLLSVFFDVLQRTTWDDISKLLVSSRDSMTECEYLIGIFRCAIPVFCPPSDVGSLSSVLIPCMEWKIKDTAKLRQWESDFVSTLHCLSLDVIRNSVIGILQQQSLARTSSVIYSIFQFTLELLETDQSIIVIEAALTLCIDMFTTFKTALSTLFSSMELMSLQSRFFVEILNFASFQFPTVRNEALHLLLQICFVIFEKVWPLSFLSSSVLRPEVSLRVLDP